MAMVRKKQDDKYLEALRELITTGGGNRQCFDCGQKGPTYVNMTIGSFVCTRCSGVLRGITPPHRVKSISMATFTQDELDFLKSHGNDVCAKTWLGLWDPKRAVHQDQRELMIDKYERKRYYLEPASPLKSLTNATNLKTTAAATLSTSSSTATVSSAHNSQNNSSKTQIQLTPPTSQRTTANGLHKTSSTAISRPQHTTPQPQNSFSSSLSSHNTDAFGLHNGLNSAVGSMSSGALSDTSSCTSANGFGAEADFVADFGSADIFNATVAVSPASTIGSSTTNSGYAKIQPMKMSAAAHQQFINGHGGGGGGKATSNSQNGNLVSSSSGSTENFADFDHAPIYNAAVDEAPNYQFIRKNAIRKKSTSSLSGSVIRRNERQLRDILEIDNNENSVDYITFNDGDVFGETKTTATNSSRTTGFSNLFDDFDNLPTLNDNRQQTNFKQFENDYANVGVNYLAGGSTFTPLALAAHATALAVLGNQSHFNSQPQTTGISTAQPFTSQWNVWPAPREITSNIPAATTLRFPNNNNLTQQPYQVAHLQQQQQQQIQQLQQQPYQQHIYASINNLNTQLQYPHQYSYFPSSSFSSQSLTHPSATTFQTGITTTSQATSAALTSKLATTSMLNKNTINTTNPFRMHLDVNDNYNTINYDNDYSFNNTITTTNIITPTTLATTTTSTENTDFNANFNNDFNFVSNSVLSYNFDIFSNATTSSTTSSMATAIAAKQMQNYCNMKDKNNNFGCIQNSKVDFNNVDDADVEGNEITKNPFVNSLNNSKTEHEDLANAPQFPIYQSPPYYIITSSIPSSCLPTFNSSVVSCTAVSQKNPFNPATLSDHSTHTVLDHNDDDDVNTNIQNSSNRNSNSNYYYSTNSNSNYHNENYIDATRSTKDVANRNYFKSDSNPNCNFNSLCCNAKNDNANQIPNNYKNENYNNNNNSWRLPINNNNNKLSTTNGFNNNNNNNINNNNNSSAPAEDRYAALKDLDEQLRESKAVAAQAASIVTANVVDFGFGNPNVNGTVNPFATQSHHHHQQTAVVNPFQNASNNPTQNTTQQLFGQMTLIPNGIAAANGFLNAQKTHTANTGFFNYTASGFTNAAAATPQMQQQQQQQQQNQASLLYPTSIQTGPNGCGFGFGTLQQQITSAGTGLTTNTFSNPFAATAAHSSNPFL